MEHRLKGINRMKRFYWISSILGIVLSGCTVQKPVPAPAEAESAAAPSAVVGPTVTANPLIVNFNQLNDFAHLKAEHVPAALDYSLNAADSILNRILAIPDSERTFENTIAEQDNMEAVTGRIVNPIYLMSEVHPDKEMRTVCDSAIIRYEKWHNDLILNEDLYRAVKAYAAQPEAGTFTGLKKKYLTDVLKDYRRLGFDLSREKREELKAIKNRISEIGLEFDKNITEYTDTLIVTDKEMEGLPQWYKDKMRAEDGTYKIDISYPSRSMFMKYSKSEAARKALSEKYLNRGRANLEVIPRLVEEHDNMAHLLGYRSYAEYLLEDRMPKTPETVWAFENDLKANLRPKAEAEFAELLKVKKEVTGIEDSVINYWNMFYYENILDEQKYQLNDEEIKPYFSLENVLQGMFEITGRILGLEYKQVQNPSVWYPDVSLYEVTDAETGKRLGYFYLDLYPREGKYSHAAHFGISKGKLTKDGYEYPVAALVTNFPKPTADRPSLLRHGPNGNVETFFHEFGHLLHGMVTNVPYWTYSGTSVDRDFVEAPSQIFENWIWEKESVKLFARHYQTGEPIPDELLDRMLAAKNRSSGNDYSFQVFLGSLDLTLYDRWDPKVNETVLDVARRLHNEILLWKETPNTARVTSFGHLNGYAASYYGYAWSRVLAQDMFSVFKKNGVLDQDTGLRFRRQVLAPGGSRDPMELVKDFLGREPNSQALVESLGI